jgi:CHASE3 domain sensor protein
MIGSRSITRRLAIAFGMIVGISAVSAAFVVYETAAVRSSVEESAGHTAIRDGLARYESAVNNTNRAILFLINSSDIGYLPAYEDAREKVTEAANNLRAVAERVDSDDARTALQALASVSGLFEQWESEVASRQITDLDNAPRSMSLASDKCRRRTSRSGTRSSGPSPTSFIASKCISRRALRCRRGTSPTSS